ncbi:MAG: endonuclease domain-containing protein [Patescibacteria group bacterium]
MQAATYNHRALIDYRRKLRQNMTPPEVVLWAHLKGKGLGVKFRRQHSIGRYIVDFYCPAKQLVVEVDGDHHGEPRQRAHDYARDMYLQSLGLRVLRISARSLSINHYGVLDTIRCLVQHPS